MDYIGAIYAGQYYLDTTETTPENIAGDNAVWDDKWDVADTTRRTTYVQPEKYRR